MKEKLISYQGERVLGMGFTRRAGLGYVMGIGYTTLGAELTVGGSSEASVQLALRNYQKRDGVDPNLLSAFPADLRDSNQIDAAIASLTRPPSIVVYASATGMEGFFLPMNEYLAEMKTIEDTNEPDAAAQIEDKKKQLREKLAVWVPQHYADALAVNRTAPEYLINRLTDRFGSPFRFVYINSSFGYEGKGPIHYSNVYQTKHLMSIWMSENAASLTSQGIDMHEEVDPVIDDTDIGISIMEEISPFWPERIQQVIKQTRVSRHDVFESVKLFTDMTTEQRSSLPRPNRHFLVRRGSLVAILDHFPEELVINVEEFDF